MKIVKGGASIQYPWGSYRMGYDIVQRKEGQFYLSVMNGPLEIFAGPFSSTLEGAEELGLVKLRAENPALASNLGVN